MRKYKNRYRIHAKTRRSALFIFTGDDMVSPASALPAADVAPLVFISDNIMFCEEDTVKHRGDPQKYF